METDTSGNGCRVTVTAMEYADGQIGCTMTCTTMEYAVRQMEEYTMDNGNKVREMAMDITGGKMAKNTMESTKMICQTERESNKSKANCTQSNMKKGSLSARVKYRRLLENDLF
jgi:hypothetical protein